MSTSSTTGPLSTGQTAPWPETPSGDETGTGAAGEASRSRGETVIAPGVLATVAGKAAGEVEGVEVVNGSGLLSKRQGATADVATRDQTAVELHLAVCWPHPVAEVTERVRQRVREQVRTLTGFEVIGVDITVDRLPLPSGRRAGRRVE